MGRLKYPGEVKNNGYEKFLFGGGGGEVGANRGNVYHGLFPYFTIMDQFAAACETTRWFVEFHYGTMELFWTQFPI